MAVLCIEIFSFRQPFGHLGQQNTGGTQTQSAYVEVDDTFYIPITMNN